MTRLTFNAEKENKGSKAGIDRYLDTRKGLLGVYVGDGINKTEKWNMLCP